MRRRWNDAISPILPWTFLLLSTILFLFNSILFLCKGSSKTIAINRIMERGMAILPLVSSRCIHQRSCHQSIPCQWDFYEACSTLSNITESVDYQLNPDTNYGKRDWVILYKFLFKPERGDIVVLKYFHAIECTHQKISY